MANEIPNTVLSRDLRATVVEGRVTTLELPDLGQVDSIEVLAGPEYGNVTVNPDNTLSVVLSGTTDTTDLNFSLSVTYADGNVATISPRLDVEDSPSGQGWGLGQHYTL